MEGRDDEGGRGVGVLGVSSGGNNIRRLKSCDVRTEEKFRLPLY